MCLYDALGEIQCLVDILETSTPPRYNEVIKKIKSEAYHALAKRLDECEKEIRVDILLEMRKRAKED